MSLHLEEFTEALKQAWSALLDEGDVLKARGKCGETYGGMTWVAVCSLAANHEGKHGRE